jgi:hypothetical protein
MRLFAPVMVAILFGTAAIAQNADPQLGAELEAIHSKWFLAFDSGDGATMDSLEVDNLVLAMPDGSIWAKDGRRAGKQSKRDAVSQRDLSQVTVRRFGDTAILTGIVTNEAANETDRAATTVVFVRRDGKWLIASAQWSPVESGK